MQAYLPRDVPEDLRGTVTTRPVPFEHRVRQVAYVTGAILGVGALGFALLTHLGHMPWDPTYRTDWLLVALVVGLGPLSVWHAREVRRNQAIDDHFPDFLRDLAESARGGMTLPRALQSAARGQYGALTPEIQRMSHQVEWGIQFGEAFDRFAERARSPLIRRTVNLIQEARRSGGNMVDVLTAAAEDAREIKQIVEQRQNQMRAYTMVVYVTFAVFLGTVLLLQLQLVPAFQRAALSGGGSVAVGGIRFDTRAGDAFHELFFHAALIQAVTGGLIAGVLRRGNPIAGLRPVAIMVGATWVCFRFVAGGG
ncbi:MAG TPA: type II secretion system F family protein [Candidatus Thermoplasmatota archaeon]|nr:type II secretion system F family protein [Candidatus Thermoplasmatota archaeon]